MQYDPTRLDLSAIASFDTRGFVGNRQAADLAACVEARRLELEQLNAQNEHLERLIATAKRVNEGLKREHDLALQNVRKEAARR